MHHHLILRVVSKMLIPPILLYALYVQFHGDFGPGGGFQAGVIFAVAFILYGIVFSLDHLRRAVPPHIVRRFVALGLLIYAGVGVANLFLGGNFLDYSTLAHDAKHGQHYGILLVELGVGITVAAVMISIFFAFASRPPTIKDTDW
ncbi:putative monovalent cation/H+ antiporter subunit B [Tepidicaulis marinus]|uniref:Putative monovalent cation/H+ antiporter subunit B n=1 Tax=Tepidicaulis marinus TaxID=1333998 RepID=A0A081B7N8_9HYPH|nr:Na(+)/H(+) antiporter subunit B [Tepidicaulis marinus]GAK44056.1 putative monovalent cation/H+ antiporter subunit B [Tepidicaulis marinus]